VSQGAAMRDMYSGEEGLSLGSWLSCSFCIRSK
jgi:hypothetical protein